MSDLRARIRDLVPAMDYGLEALLRLVEVEETHAVPTAAVPLGGRPRLLVNPDFVAAHCRTDEALWTLVLHELHHVLLGHTRLYERITPLHNLAFDAVINAMLCRRNPAPAWTALFRQLYRPDVFPELLLRPPEGFPDPPSFAPSVKPAWRAALHHLYYEQAGTFGEVYDLLVEELQVEERRVGIGAGGGVGELLERLLGSHDEDERGVQAQDDPALFAAVRRIVERWPQPPDPRVGRSMDEVLRSRSVAVPDRSAHAAPLRRALLAVAQGGRPGLGARGERAVTVEQPWPGRDRRAFALAAAGHPALLHRRSLPDPHRSGPRPVALYVDVSGSVLPWLPELLAAVRSCRALVAPTVYAFSTQVVETPLSQLVQGRFDTTQGTEGACFTAHLAQHRPAGAVVLTDGYVGPIPREHLPACHAARLQVVLTPHGWRGDLAPAAHAIHHLEAP